MQQQLPGGTGGNGAPLCPCCGQPFLMPNTNGMGPQVALPEQEMGLPAMGGNQPSPQADATSALLMALMGGGMGGMQ